VRPGAVVVAAGGFEANRAWLREYWGEAADRFAVRGTPFNDGLALRLLIDSGARQVGDPRGVHAIAVDDRGPSEDGGIVTRLDTIPFGIVVNRDAQRFYDEGEDLWPKRYATWGRLIAEQPGQIAYSILDDRARGSFMPSLYPPITAPTIGELADALGLDPVRLTATVEAFNGATSGEGYDPGRLDGCGTHGLAPPKSNWARRLEVAPFAAYPLRPGITFTYLGVAVDRQARIQRTHDGPFENVFAAGEVMSGNILTRGYLAGFGLTVGSTFGRIAGREAARHALA
jgi:tricarballylate dehydrogenase